MTDDGDEARSAEELKRQLGDVRFRRFVAQLERIVSANDPKIYPWHAKVLDRYDAVTRVALPRTPATLLALVRRAIDDPPALSMEDVPAWIGLEELDGNCPVQGHGTLSVGGRPARWAWYFRARWQHWSISAVPEGDDPCGEPLPGRGFSHEEEYEYRTGDYDAGYMPLETALHYIVRELTRFRDRRRVVSES